MKAYLSIIIAAVWCLCGLTSCQERYNPTEEWRRENEKAFADFASNTDFKTVTVDGSTAFVYMRYITHGKGTTNPIETSRVELHYSYAYLSGNKAQIDGNFDSEKPATVPLNREGADNNCVLGLRIALQNMVVGDETEVIIPWYLGYGSKATNSVRAYSALRYHLKLDSIIPESAL